MCNAVKWLAILPLVLAASWGQAAETLEEVVVTATKRAANIQDVPVSVGVVTGEFIDTFDVQDMNDVQSYVPGLSVQETFGSWAVRIRGLGSGITNLAFDASVPVYVDDVYCGRGKCMESAFLDLERLEVARGPQGALFGKSTIAGAISAISARPTEDFEASVKAGWEFENGGWSARGHVSGPLGDSLRGRLAVRLGAEGGYTENLALARDDGDRNAQAIRAILEWQPSAATLVHLKLETGDWDSEGRNNQLVNPGFMSRSSMDPNAEYVSDDVRSVSTGEPQEDFYDYQWNAATLRLEFQPGDLTVLAILGRWDYGNEWFLDVDGHPEPILNTALFDDYEQTTAEVRLLSPAGRRLEYIVGFWWQDSDLTTRQYSPFYAGFWRAHPLRNLPVQLANTRMPLDEAAVGTGMDRNFMRSSEAISFYGQLTWRVTDQVSAIFDIRHTDEDQDGTGWSFPLTFPMGRYDAPMRTSNVGKPTAERPFGHNLEYRFTQSRSDDSLDPSLRIQWDVHDDLMTYFAYATGSKAGGLKANDATLGDQLFAMRNNADFLQRYAGLASLTDAELAAGVSLQQGNGLFDFADEEAESLEWGLKATLLDGAATLGLALFNTEFTNLQTSNYDGTRFIIGNAGSATVNGLEVEFSWQATPQLRLHAALSAINAEYDDWEGAQCVEDAMGMPRNDDCVGSGTRARENQAGERLERSPETEANLSLLYERPVGSALLLTAAASLYYSGDYFVQPTQAPYATQDAFTKFDLRVSLAPLSERWELGLTARNLGGEMTIQHAYNIGGSHFRNLSVGRTIALEGGLRF